MRGAGWQIGNVDATVIAQAPRLAPHIAAMRQRVAGALGVALDQVSIKAKTAEKMGPVGHGEAMEARAVCLIFKQLKQRSGAPSARSPPSRREGLGRAQS